MPAPYKKVGSTEWTPPKTFDEYRVLWTLGRGGMGEVYLGHDMLLDRAVAIKFIRALEPDDLSREQFLIEARASARLQHPNVVTVFRVGEIDGRPFIVSEYIRGQNLDRAERPMPAPRVLELAIGLSRGLAAAHRRGVLHRDIKPGNVIIPIEGGVKLLDFGLAKFVEGHSAIDLENDTPPSASSSESMAETIDTKGVTIAPTGPSPFASAETPQQAIPAQGVTEQGVTPKRESNVSVGYRPLFSMESLKSFPPARVPSAESHLPSFVSATSTPGTNANLNLNLNPNLNDDPNAVDTNSDTHDLKYVSGLKGTPLYMAPEVLGGEPATRRSDIYSLGALLFELCTGAPPNISTTLADLQHVVATKDTPSLASVVKGIEPRLAAIIDRCLRRDPALRFATADELRTALEALVAGNQKDEIPAGNPYRGLLPFEAQHRSLFFGRKAEIGTLIDRLRTESFLLVAADSGVGKSSLCRAGVLPLIADGALGRARSYAVISLVPGRQPLASLCAAIATTFSYDEAAITVALEKDPTSFARMLRKLLEPGRGLFLFLDQMEELVTIGDPAQSAIVSEALASLAFHGDEVRLLCTARSDFLARLAMLPSLGDDITRALYLLRPMGVDKLREAVTGPALIKGVSFESEALVDSLVQSTARTDGGLPLLQFALAELWEARAGGVITAEALDSIGGVSGALARHGDHVFGALPVDQRQSARRILMSLVTMERTRARRNEEELTRSDPAARPALEALVRGRLLVARDTAEGAAYEVAHEALIRGWDTLSHWLDEHAESRAVKQRLETAAYEWNRLGRAKENLWSARQLTETRLLEPHDIGPRETAFLDASQWAVQRSRRLRRAGFVAVPVILGLLYGATQIAARRDVGRRVAVLEKRGRSALSDAQKLNSKVEQLRQEAFGLIDGQQHDPGEASWQKALALSADADRSFARAGQELEAALTLDGGSIGLRSLLAQTLFERALAAERDNQLRLRDDLLQRMAVYDATGEQRQKWNAPGNLSLNSAPAKAQVKLEQYVADEQQRRTLASVPFVPTTPIDQQTLAPGSYLLTLTAPGYDPVRYPFVLKRGEQARFQVPLLAKSAIPEGFVYVPPGRFLYGSTNDDALRRLFLTAPPLHQVTTAGYFIAAHETTYAQWIEFLQALPVDEKKKHTPTAGNMSVSGNLELHELPDGRWSLTLKPRTDVFSAASNEPLRYPARKHRAAQNWLQFPVGGISADDAEAYLAWLANTGKVPGARLCSDAEWERAARGADDRVYPHGDFLQPDDANYDETYDKALNCMGPDEVGSHPATRSPFGLDDMVGNNQEWTRSVLVADELVVRGGAFEFDQLTSYSTNRTPIDRTIRWENLGLRVCATLPPPSAAK